MSIPAVIHQIWIGEKPLPTEWIQTWKDKNPNMEHRLWREADIDALQLVNTHKYSTFKRRRQYHGAADVARVEILERFGGVYIDADSVCLESIEDEPFMRSSFFAVYEYDRRVANGVIGATAGHPILKMYIQRIKEANVIYPPCFTIGGTLLTTCIDIHGDDPEVVLLPTCSFYPYNKKREVPVVGKIYADQFWGTTNKLY